MRYVTGLALLFFAFSAGAQTEQPQTAALDPVLAAPDKSTQEPTAVAAPRFGGSLDLYAPLPLQNSKVDGDRFRIRSASLTLGSSVDQHLDIFMRVEGVDQDSTGVFVMSLDEGYVRSNKLLQRLDARVGKFYLNVGLLNSVILAALPFPSVPREQEKFFAANGVVDTGFEATWSFSQEINLVAGVTDGYTYSHADSNGGTRPLAPTHYLHPTWSSNAHPIEIGLNYLARTDSDSQLTRLTGIDLRYGLKTEGHTSVQTEWYDQFKQPFQLPLSEEIGGYVFVAHQVTQHWTAGLRGDAYTIRSLENPGGGKRQNLDYAFVPVLNYLLSEHALVKSAYTFSNQTREGSSDHVEQRVEVQLAAIL